MKINNFTTETMVANLDSNEILLLIAYTVKPVLSGPSKKDQHWLSRSLNAGQKYDRMLKESTSLSHHLSLRSLFCLFLSDHFQTGFTVRKYLIFNGYCAFYFSLLCGDTNNKCVKTKVDFIHRHT